jgi:hypothetical protein
VERKQVKTFEKCFENANSVLKVLVVLWDTYWSYPIEKKLREEHGGVLL